MFYWSVDAPAQVTYHIEKRFINWVLAKIFEGLCIFHLMLLFLFFSQNFEYISLFSISIWYCKSFIKLHFMIWAQITIPDIIIRYFVIHLVCWNLFLTALLLLIYTFHPSWVEVHRPCTQFFILIFICTIIVGIQ